MVLKVKGYHSYRVEFSSETEEKLTMPLRKSFPIP